MKRIAILPDSRCSLRSNVLSEDGNDVSAVIPGEGEARDPESTNGGEVKPERMGIDGSAMAKTVQGIGH